LTANVSFLQISWKAVTQLQSCKTSQQLTENQTRQTQYTQQLSQSRHKLRMSINLTFTDSQHCTAERFLVDIHYTGKYSRRDDALPVPHAARQ